MGKYVRGDKIYVLSQITSVDTDDTTKYKVKTNSAKFYVSEKKDMLVVDPKQDIVTNTELYNVLKNLNALDSTDFTYVFDIYNNTHGTHYNFSNIMGVLASDLSYETVLEIYQFYIDTREIKVGDIVRVLLNGTTDSKYCGVLHIEMSNLNTVYTLYDADEDYVYSLTRDDAQIIRYNVENKDKAPVESLFSAIKENISKVTGDIDRTHDDPSEN